MYSLKIHVNEISAIMDYCESEGIEWTIFNEPDIADGSSRIADFNFFNEEDLSKAKAFKEKE